MPSIVTNVGWENMSKFTLILRLLVAFLFGIVDVGISILQLATKVVAKRRIQCVSVYGFILCVGTLIDSEQHPVSEDGDARVS
jgi:hypothetical protein